MREAFEQAIVENPDDPASYAAYGDWLTEQGDPRGEFIQVQLELERPDCQGSRRQELQKREGELLDAHQREWLGPLAPLLLDPPSEPAGDFDIVPSYEFQFARGFLHTLRTTALSVQMARTLRDASQRQFLRELSFDYIVPEEECGFYEPGDDVPTMAQDNVQFVSVYPLLGRETYPCLRYLRVGEEIDMDVYLQGRYGPGSLAYCNPAAVLVSKMPRLEELHLLCKGYDIDRLFDLPTLSHLRKLRIYHLGVKGANLRERTYYPYPLDRLARNPAFRNLTHLLFHPHHKEYGAGSYGSGRLPSYLPLEQVQVLLRSQHLPNLTHLQLRLSNMGDAGCRAIVESGILRRLKWLDLRHGCITDEGARIIAACPEVKGLEHLDLSGNAVTEEGVRALRAVGVQVRADASLTPQELADEEYLYHGDFE